VTFAEKVAAAPEAPGVYLLKDAKGRVLYVGKARSLRERLRAYTQPQESPRLSSLVSKATDLENSNGERLDRGLNGRVTSNSWLEAGGVFAAYAQPEYLIGRDTDTGRLVEGYAKGRAGFLELVVGREPLWWGPGFHGSMLVSNNALGLDMIRLQTANQI
jgi:hypothetical protein